MGLHRRYEEILCAAGMEKPGRLAGGNAPVDGTGWMTLSVNESDERRLRRAFERMMRRLHEAETGAELRVEFLAEDEPQAFIREHQGILTGALEEVEMSEGMRSRLNSSHYVFSGMKTFHELKEAFPELTRADGSRKSFREFLDDVRKVDETYNKSWLRAEYNFAHRSAQIAARWEASEKNGDRYLLQYRTQSDGKVRPEHAALHGVTLEKGDGFWDYYLPPNGWGCRCTVVEVLRDQYAKTPHDEAMELGEEATQNDRRNMFRWNSGKKGRTFPDYNPYTIRRCRDCDMNSGKGKLAFVPENEVCEACKLIRDMQQQARNRRLSGEERASIQNAALTWADKHLPKVTMADGSKGSRLTITTNEGFALNVGKKFFTETFSKCKNSRKVAETMEMATLVSEWIKDAHHIRTEPGRHHNYDFEVFKATHDGKDIEFKAKATDGLIVYCMRLI